MARVSPKQHSFARGEISPRLYGRDDTELYYTALEVARNYVVDGRAILERRPGTRFLGRTKDDGYAELVPFVYDETQSYVLEFGENYFRAWFGFGQVYDGANPSETVTPFLVGEVDDVSYTQSRDTMWMAHRNHRPSLVKRTTENTFSFEHYETVDGPYLDTNSDQAKTLAIANGGTASVGRGVFSDTMPAGIVVGSVITIWDGSAAQTITVQSIDGSNNRIETDWTGDTILSTAQWSYDGNVAPDGLYLSFQGNVTDLGTLTAVGHTPFNGGRDVGRWVRMLETKSTDPSDSLEERFEWHWVKIVGVISDTQALIEWTDGGTVSATADWRLGAFYPGNFPSYCTFHENRLCFGVRNTTYMSAPGDYSNYGPSDKDSSVNPDNAITVSIPAVNDKKGSVSDITFMQSLGFQLVIGTPGGIHTIQSSSFGEGLEPDNVTRRAQDSRGAALCQPIVIGESVIYLHSSRQKLMGTYFKDSLDRLGVQDLSLPSDHLCQAKIKGVTWQEEPYSIAWGHMDDGTMSALTIQPEEKVQGWHRHDIGGSCVVGGINCHAQVESVANVPQDGGGDDRLYMTCKRTIDGSDRRFVEVMMPYWELGQDVRDGWYLDAALKYEGNADTAKTITFTGTGTAARSAVTNFTSPAMVDGKTLVFHDGRRWHHGRISAVDASNNFTWTPTMPNAGPGPADDRWHRVDDSWVQLGEDDEIDVFAQTYVEPINQTNITKWSQAVTTLSGLDDLEGQEIDLLVDGWPVKNKTVSGGQVTGLPGGHIILAGLPYETKGKLLSIEAGSQNGSAKNKQRPVYEVAIDVLESRNLESGTAMPSSYQGEWEQYDPVKFEDQAAPLEGEPPPLHSGYKRVTRDEQGQADDPSIAWRQIDPLPSIVRGVITRVAQSDGR